MSNQVQVASAVLLLVGAADLFAVELVLSKMVKKAEEAVSPFLPAEQQKPLQAKRDAMVMIQNIMRIGGFAFVLIGLYGIGK